MASSRSGTLSRRESVLDLTIQPLEDSRRTKLLLAGVGKIEDGGTLPITIDKRILSPVLSIARSSSLARLGRNRPA
jgi:hypothetical protein